MLLMQLVFSNSSGRVSFLSTLVLETICFYMVFSSGISAIAQVFVKWALCLEQFNIAFERCFVSLIENCLLRSTVFIIT